MSNFLAWLIVVAAIVLVWWFVSSLFPRQPSEPVDDPLSPVPVPRKRGPRGKAGAVALDEPDEGDPADAFPPRRL